MTVLIEKEILGFNVSVGDTLGMQILDTLQDLFETTLDFTRAHAAALDRSVEIAARTVLHDFTPVLVLILDEIDGLDDVDVVERRGNTEFRSEFLDVFLLGLVFATFAELL
jgi:hypothetical protein